jgi:hypothetical protein
MTPLPPRGLRPAKPFPKPITTPPQPDNPPRKPYCVKNGSSSAWTVNVLFRLQSWIRNASDRSIFCALIALRAVGSESALPIQTKEPSSPTRNTSRASIVAPRRDKVTRDIRVTRTDLKTAKRGDLWELSILTGLYGRFASETAVRKDHDLRHGDSARRETTARLGSSKRSGFPLRDAERRFSLYFELANKT